MSCPTTERAPRHNLLQRLSLLLLLCHASGCVPGLEGHVSDSISGAPVADATVEVVETECIDTDYFLGIPYCDQSVEHILATTTTDADGFYTIKDPADGEDLSLRVSHPDYETGSVPLGELPDHDSKVVDVSLVQLPPADVIGLTAEWGPDGVTLSWSMPPDERVVGVLIVRSDQGFGSPVNGTEYVPGDVVDSGVAIYVGSDTTFTDTQPASQDGIVRYAVYAYTEWHVYSYGESDSVFVPAG